MSYSEKEMEHLVKQLQVAVSEAEAAAKAFSKAVAEAKAFAKSDANAKADVEDKNISKLQNFNGNSFVVSEED